TARRGPPGCAMLRRTASPPRSYNAATKQVPAPLARAPAGSSLGSRTVRGGSGPGGPMSDSIDCAPEEKGRFAPPGALAREAHLSDLEEYQRLYRQSLDDPETFWGEAAREFHWFEPWERVLEWNEPHAAWFVGGKTNLAYNCLDLQIERGLGNKVAFFWEGEPGDKRALTYADLLDEVSRFANVLKGKGVKQGDVVAIYLPMIPEAIVAMLACARIGATHSVVFGGF